MRISIALTLFEKTAPEDNELQTSWDIQASANVRSVPAGWADPGEQTIEDIQIDEVTTAWMTYGTEGSVVVPVGMGSQFGRREADRALTWLRSQLPEREDWLERLSQEAARRAPDYLYPVDRSVTNGSLPCFA